MTAFPDSTHDEGKVFDEEVVGGDEEELAGPERDGGTSVSRAPKSGELKRGWVYAVRPPEVGVEGFWGLLGSMRSLSFLSQASEQ